MIRAQNARRAGCYGGSYCRDVRGFIYKIIVSGFLVTTNDVILQGNDTSYLPSFVELGGIASCTDDLAPMLFKFN